MSGVKSWLLAARPKTLTAAFVPVILATALVQLEGFQVKWWVTACCLAGALLIQIATNFFNDAIDFKKGADTSDRIGPKRVTQSGLISQNQVITFAIALLVAAAVVGVPLVMAGGWPILVIGLISMFLAYSYTGGPLPLAYLGLGDLFVVLFFGLIAVGGVYYLHTGVYSLSAFVLGLQIGLLSTVLIAINNLRDVHQDRLANKRTLAVRFGMTFVRAEIIFLIALAFTLQLFWYWSGFRWAAYLPFIFSPLAIYLCSELVKNDPSATYNKYLAQSALLHSGFGLVLAVGLYTS